MERSIKLGHHNACVVARRFPAPLSGTLRTLPQLVLDDITITVDPESGMDILWAEGTRRPFLAPRIPGQVAEPATHLALASTLHGALRRLPMWNQTPLAGFEPGVTSLHNGLVGMTPKDLSWRARTGIHESSVEASYLIPTAITGAPFGQCLQAWMEVKLDLHNWHNWEVYSTVIRRKSTFVADVPSYLFLLDHPNYMVQSADRIYFNRNRKWLVYDRDGKTPPGHNAFTGIDHSVLGKQHVPERCFFCWLEPDENNEIPVLVYNPNFGSLGFVYRADPNYPAHVMVWSSPLSDSPDLGVGAVEYGPLPVGAKRARGLELVRPLERGQSVTRECSLYLLDSPETAGEFAEKYGITTDSQGLEEIGPDWDEGSQGPYDADRCTWPTLRDAAGLPPLGN